MQRAASKKIPGGVVGKLRYEFDQWLKSSHYSKTNVAQIQILAIDEADQTLILNFGDTNERFQIGFKYWRSYPTDLTSERVKALLVTSLRDSRATFAIFKVTLQLVREKLALMPQDCPFPLSFVLTSLDEAYTKLTKAQTRHFEISQKDGNDDAAAARFQELLDQGLDPEEFFYQEELTTEESQLIERIEAASLSVSRKPEQEKIKPIKKVLLKALHNCQLALAERKEIQVEVSSDPMKWLVHMNQFKGNLAQDFTHLLKLFPDIKPEVTLEILFSEEYPRHPPIVHIIQPRIITMQDVMMGGTLCLSILTSNWNPQKGMDHVFSNIYDVFSQQLRIDLKTKQPKYNDTEFRASYFQMAPLAVSTRCTFKSKFNCVSSAFTKITQSRFLEEYGNKILFPDSVLAKISDDPELEFPLTFELITKRGLRTYCGVSMFTAPPRTVILPQRMMQNLSLSPTEDAQFKIVKLPLGITATFRPKTKNFYNLADPVQTLSRGLINYTALTIGDTIHVFEAGEEYVLHVLKTSPGPFIKIVAEPFLELKIDFEPALDYEEPRDPLEVPYADSDEESSED